MPRAKVSPTQLLAAQRQAIAVNKRENEGAIKAVAGTIPDALPDTLSDLEQRLAALESQP